ncbi:MAG: hypothetical protein M3A44_08805 [Gammaproteobacteria bacterium]
MNPTTQEKSHKAVVCMTTFNRIDCARINQEIIKLNYTSPFPIVHACSSSNYQKYLEDVLIPCEQPSLPQSQVSAIETLQHGALNLLKRSLATAAEKLSPEYLVHLEGDTWIMDERVIHDIIAKMDQKKELMICTSAWDEDPLAFKYLKQPRVTARLHLWFAGVVRKFGYPYRLTCRDSLATQFFVIRATPEMLECFLTLEPIPRLDLEQALYRAFMARFGEQNILRQRVREPIHPFNRYVCEKLSLFSQHWPAHGTANDTRDPTHPRYISPTFDGKRETLLKFTSMRRGEHIQKLLNAQTFEYYNTGASRT